MPWQEKLINGFAKGEMVVISAGRQTGKSYYSQYVQMFDEIMGPPFKKLTQATVDGELWYTVKCKPEVASWIRTQAKSLWYEHIDANWYVYKNTFDINEKLYTAIGIKF